LSDLLVFGRRAGLAAAENSKRVAALPVDTQQLDEGEREMLELFERSEGDSPYELHRQLQENMQDLIGIFRNEADLQKGLNQIQILKERTEQVRVDGSRLFNPGWHLARDLKSMLTVSEAVALSALARKESRGAHSRIDYANYDDTWARQNNIVARDGSEMKLRQLPIVEMPPELQSVLEEGK
jgi:succinate dehydrogenase / fumarate reductase flavoprotein subunit